MTLVLEVLVLEAQVQEALVLEVRVLAAQAPATHQVETHQVGHHQVGHHLEAQTHNLYQRQYLYQTEVHVMTYGQQEHINTRQQPILSTCDRVNLNITKY